MDKKVILITGATGGIGLQTAQKLANQGHIIYGTGRQVNKLNDLAQYGINGVQLDVTNESSMIEAVKKIISKEGHIDILVNNAGYGSYGAIEDVSIEEARKQFDVNLFGLARLTQIVLPEMRKNNTGRIINISSMGGRLTSYMGAWYHATKYALEGFSDALRMEVKEFGIDVILIEPGGIKTNWGFIAAEHLEESSKNGVYRVAGKKAAEGMRKQYSSNMLSKPEVIAKAISKAINDHTPKTRYLVGFGAKPLVFLHTILPTKLFDYIMMHAS